MTASGARAAEGGARPVRVAEAVRQALERGLLVGLFAALGAALLTSVVGLASGGAVARDATDLLLFAAIGVAPGLVAAPVTLVERLATRFAPSRGRDWGAGVLAGLVALAAVPLAVVQLSFTLDVYRSGSLQSGANAIQGLLRQALDNPLAYALDTAMFAAPFVPHTVGRLRRLDVGAHTGFNLYWTLSLAVPLATCALFAFERRLGGAVLDVFVRNGMLVFLLALTLPPLSRLADRIDRRVRAWLEDDREDAGPAPPAPDLVQPAAGGGGAPG